ncbi:ATP-dependent DNA helicase [uncultured Xylophilus sp.]|uniref:ATP-dependent DNA helicase n=1 Tax=uncultured Xylophilus sp. TaxID=296832 RepID=UPI0025DEACBD|nr:ATP-dependent DNA helicase [uncultured Xylophilus sp.]
MSSTPATPLPTVAVRALCAFGARRGDLDRRFTPSPTAEDGIAGHAAIAARRPAHHRSELVLSGDWRGRLTVRGRADGFDPQAVRLEEIKTHRGDLARQPANQRHLHWAQARVYGWLLCQSQGLPQVELALVYVDIADLRETVFAETWTAEALHAEFDALCAGYVAWADQERRHRAARDAALAVLAFPHPDFRAGQRGLAEAVYRTQRSGRVLMAQAPTGIGKTVGTLFPALRACPPAGPDRPGLDRLCFLTAKTSGRQLALDALALLRGPAVPAAPGADAAARTAVDRVDAAAGAGGADGAGDAGPTPAASAPTSIRVADDAAGTGDAAPAGTAVTPPRLPLRVLELVARDKACEHPDRACHGASCPLAAGFYDRLPAARAALAAGDGFWDRAGVRRAAAAHRVCPYYLAQEMARWADVVVGDVNYWFDASALLPALAAENDWRCGLLVDEAHNLVERARGMYSAALDPAALHAARAAAPAALRTPLERLRRAWKPLLPPDDAPTQEHDAVPAALCRALQQAATAIADHLAAEPDTTPGGALQRLLFDAARFLRLAESFGAHSLCDATRQAPPPGVRGGPAAVLHLRNVVPAPFLAPRWAAARSAVLFSATLEPQAFHRDLLGLPADAAWIDVPPPFAAAQLQVRVSRDISTRWPDRARSLPAIVSLIGAQYAAAPGHYLAFFSSFDYLRQAADALRAAAPDIPVWEQSRGMDEAARTAFLQRFVPAGRGIGFAVLGGAFGEGIDLPGDRLVGAFIATLGLPQVNPVNERMRDRMQATFGAGYDYTYRFPGLQKVVQAAGRVIRTPTDRGVLCLMDDRFARPETRRLLPAWWALPD